MKKTKPLKICLVSSSPPPYGGISRWVTLVLGFAKSQSDVAFYLVDVAPRWRRIDDLTHWKRIIFGGVIMIWHLIQVLARLLSGCKVVHITTPGQLSVFRDIAIIRLAKIFGASTFYHIRFGRIPEISKKDTSEWRRISKAIRLSDYTIAIDKATEAAIRGQLPEINLVRIPNCVDVSRLRDVCPTENKVSTVLYLGWVVPTKGTEELISAWADLQPEGWQLHLVGPGDKSYQAQLQNKYPSSNIMFLGEKTHDEAMQMLAASDVFVLPSYTEGFPNVVLEAMALSKPIVATRVGAISEMLGNDCGILIEPGDAASLKKALTQLIKDRELSDRMGKNGFRRVITQYSIETVFSQYVKLWKQGYDFE